MAVLAQWQSTGGSCKPEVSLVHLPVHPLPVKHGWIEHLVGVTFLQDPHAHTLQNSGAPTNPSLFDKKGK